MKQLSFKVQNIGNGNVTFCILNQSHRGVQFGKRSPKFVAKNGCEFVSCDYPEVSCASPVRLFVQGTVRRNDSQELTLPYAKFVKFQEAADEYNEFFAEEEKTGPVTDPVNGRLYLVKGKKNKVFRLVKIYPAAYGSDAICLIRHHETTDSCMVSELRYASKKQVEKYLGNSWQKIHLAG